MAPPNAASRLSATKLVRRFHRGRARARVAHAANPRDSWMVETMASPEGHCEQALYQNQSVIYLQGACTYRPAEYMEEEEEEIQRRSSACSQ
jgi:hypothetical protein